LKRAFRWKNALSEARERQIAEIACLRMMFPWGCDNYRKLPKSTENLPYTEPKTNSNPNPNSNPNSKL